MGETSILLGYLSALEYWRAVGPRFLRGKRQRREATQRAREMLAAGKKPRLSPGNRRPAGAKLPVRVLVGDAKFRTRTASVQSRVWPAIPDNSMVDAGEGFLVSTPEFCFLQMASQLTLVQLVLLAFELSGTYVFEEHGPARRRESPLTSIKKLNEFVGAAENASGRAKALRALRYARDRSASPMESALAMMLCMPYSLGGYGVPYPLFNYHVDVPPSMRGMVDRAYCECDLCWPESRLCVEYDSRLHHADAEKQEEDARRRNTLITLGLTVITVSRGQLMDGGAFNRLARQVAKQTGKRLRYRDPEFTRKHLALRGELWAALLPPRT